MHLVGPSVILSPLWYPGQTSSPAVTVSHLSMGCRPFLFASASSPASWGLSSPMPLQTRQQRDSLPHLVVDKCLSCREGSGSRAALRCVLFRFCLVESCLTMTLYLDAFVSFEKFSESFLSLLLSFLLQLDLHSCLFALHSACFFS